MMDAVTAILKYIDRADAEYTARLRTDKFENDRTRNQAVGRVKQLDDIKDFVQSLVKSPPEDDGMEEIDVTGQAALDPPKIKQQKPRRW